MFEGRADDDRADIDVQRSSLVLQCGCFGPVAAQALENVRATQAVRRADDNGFTLDGDTAAEFAAYLQTTWLQRRQEIPARAVVLGREYERGPAAVVELRPDDGGVAVDR